MGLFSFLMGCGKKGPGIGSIVEIDDVKGSSGLGAAAVANMSDISGFSYNYGGSIGGDSYSYKVKQEEGKYYFCYETQEHEEYGTLEMELQPEVVSQLKQIYLDQKIYEWEGFNKVNMNVLDGDGFFLKFSFADGKSMDAHGSNAYPSGYRDFVTAMEDLFDEHVKELIQKGRDEIIAKGVKGDVNFFMVNLKQQGDSGRDSYDFLICKQGERDTNFDVKIEEKEGGYFGGGEKRYYMEVPDEAIDFAGITALLEKYEVLKWYGWEETAPDYSNCEWFQISFYFEEEGRIEAFGTAKPEHYEEFRDEFLQLMAKIVENAKENYGLVEYE